MNTIRVAKIVFLAILAVTILGSHGCGMLPGAPGVKRFCPGASFKHSLEFEHEAKLELHLVDVPPTTPNPLTGA